MTARPRSHPYLLLFGLAAVVRVGYVLTMDPGTLSWPDEATFDGIAWQLADTGRYDSSPYRATPGLPTMLALVYLVFGHSYVAARLVQALMGGLLAIAVAATGEELFDRRVGMFAGLGVAFYPPLIYLAGVFYAEHLAAVLLGLTVWALARGARREDLRFFAAAGLLAGALALTRPVYLAFLGVAVLFAAVHGPPRERLRAALLVAVAAGALIGPWTIRNAAIFDRFLPVATGFGGHLWRGNNPLARGDADDRHLFPGNELWRFRAVALEDPAERTAMLEAGRRLGAALEARGPFDQDALFRDRALAWISGNPARVPALVLQRLVTLYSPFSRTATRNEATSPRNRIVATLALLPVLALGLPGAVIALRRQRAAWIVPAAILTPTLLYVLLTAATRFRLPFDALWILLAAVALDAVLRWRLEKRGVRGRDEPGASVPRNDSAPRTPPQKSNSGH